MGKTNWTQKWKFWMIHPGKLTWQWKNQAFEDVSPIENGDFPWFSTVMLVFWRVNVLFTRVIPGLHISFQRSVIFHAKPASYEEENTGELTHTSNCYNFDKVRSYKNHTLKIHEHAWIWELLDIVRNIQKLNPIPRPSPQTYLLYSRQKIRPQQIWPKSIGGDHGMRYQLHSKQQLKFLRSGIALTTHP